MAKKTKTSKYWQKRQEKFFKNLERNEKKLLRKMDGYYAKEAQRLDKEIANYYAKYGVDNVIEYKELLARLNKQERDLLMKDMDEFFSRHPQVEHLKPMRENMYQLDRLDSLKYSVTKGQVELGTLEEQALRDHLGEAYVETYNSMMRDMGYGENLLSVSDQKVKQLIEQKWVGDRNFSDSIWKNREKLTEYLVTDFRQGIIRGDNYNELGKLLGTRFSKVSRNDIKRLVYTEGTFVQNQSMAASFIDMGYIEYEYDALLDEKTTDTCEGLNGQRFRFDEMESGTNFPPMHSWCRSSFTVVRDKRANEEGYTEEEYE